MMFSSNLIFLKKDEKEMMSENAKSIISAFTSENCCLQRDESCERLTAKMKYNLCYVLYTASFKKALIHILRQRSVSM